MARLFQRCRSGCDNLHVQDVAEYAVMLALIIAVVISVSNIGNTTNATYAEPKLQGAPSPAGS